MSLQTGRKKCFYWVVTGVAGVCLILALISLSFSIWLPLTTYLLGMAMIAFAICRFQVISLLKENTSEREKTDDLQRLGDFGLWKYSFDTEQFELTTNSRDILDLPIEETSSISEFVSYIHPDDRVSVLRQLQNPESDRSLIHYRIRTPQNELTWIELLSEPIFNKNDVCTGRNGIIRDISAIKHRESALREAHDKTEQALELADMVEWEFSPKTRRFKIRDRLGSKLFMQPGKYNFSAEEFLARIDVDARDFFVNLLGVRFSKNDKPFNLEFKFTRLDGEVFYIRTFGSRIEQDGEIIRRFGLMQDITELRFAEEALKESEKEKNLVIDTIDVGLALINPEHQLIWANKALGEFFDFEYKELTGKDFCFKFIKKDNDLCDCCPVTETLRSKKKVTTEYNFEEKILSVTSVPCFDEFDEIHNLILKVTDITEMKYLLQQLHHAQKMEAIGTMAGGIAHDFNNVLHVILGYSELAEENSETQELLKPITESARRGHDLVKQLMDFSHTETQFNPKLVDLGQSLIKFKDWIKRLIGENIQITLTVADRLPGIIADSNQIDQALLNICTNARDAMPDGGYLVIDVKVIEIEEQISHLNQTLKPGQHIVISVSDSGQGIQPKEMTRIFDPFYTTKDSGKGSGLGLSTVLSVMQKHSGMVSVSSEPNKGTTFQLYFPIPDENELDTNELALSVNIEFQSNNLRILFVEDDPMVRKITCRNLEKAGFQIMTAADGQTAIDTFAEQANNIDIVLLDVVLPRRSGREVFEFIQSTRPQTPVIFATGYAADYLESIPKGARIIHKPYSKNDLFKILKKVSQTIQ